MLLSIEVLEGFVTIRCPVTGKVRVFKTDKEAAQFLAMWSIVNKKKV